MKLSKLSTFGRVLAMMAIAGGTLGAMPVASWASGQGLTLFGGPERQYRLPFRVDFGARPDIIDRYRFRIPANKMTLAAAQFAISYPPDFNARFDPNEVEVRVKGKKVALDEVIWDRENNLIEIYPQEAVPAGNSVELIFSNVRNPSNQGMFYIKATIVSPGDLPLPRYLGIWDVTISR